MSLFGLVLTGGRSTRMGRDKGSLPWGDSTLLASSANQMRKFCSQVYISCRKEQRIECPTFASPLFDLEMNIGPAAGLLAAHRHSPHSNWMILACDFPLANEEAIQELLRQRRPGVTCFVHSDGTPEPLFSIWDSEALQELERNVEKGMTGPLYTLKRTSYHLVAPRYLDWLLNINTPEEWSQIFMPGAAEDIDCDVHSEKLRMDL